MRFGVVERWSKIAAVSWATAVFIGGCNNSPADLREWSPKDHNNTGSNVGAPNGQVKAAPAATEAPPKGLDPVTLTTWGTQCASCHGRIGRGDGPNGRMLKATDLSNPTWQAGVTDEQIAKTITSGKNSMPAFSNLPPQTVDGLVWLVRWFNSDQSAARARLDALRASMEGTAPNPDGSAPGPAPQTTGGFQTKPTPAASAKQP